MLRRRSRTLLAIAGLGIAGLAAWTGVERVGETQGQEIPGPGRESGRPGELRIVQTPGDPVTISWPAIGAFASGLALVAFAAWPRRPRNSPPPE